MARRVIAAKPSIENVQQIQSTLHRVASRFEAKNEPKKTLADEIEACKKLIWQCVGGQEIHKGKDWQCVGGQEIHKGKDGETPGTAEILVPPKVNEVNSSVHLSQKQSNPNRVNIEFRINAMKVAELKQELRDRDLDTNGLKKQLQARLLQAMFDELDTKMEPKLDSKVDPKNDEPSEAFKDQPSEEVNPAPKMAEAKNPSEEVVAASQDNCSEKDENNDAQMNDILETNEDVGKKSALNPIKTVVSPNFQHQSPVNRTESSSGKKSPQPGSESPIPLERPTTAASSPKKQVGQGSTNIKQYWKKFSKPAQVVGTSSSPVKEHGFTKTTTKQKKSPIRMVVKNVQVAHAAPSEIEVSQQDLTISQTKSDLSEDDFDRPVSDFSAASDSASLSKTGSVRDIVSKIQSSATLTATNNSSGGGNTSALSKNLQAKKEARLARMAEIREKSKPVVTSKLVLAPKEYSSTLSSLNAVSAPNKKNNLAAQMREKAAAAAKKENVSTNSNQLQPSQPSSTGKRTLPSSQMKQATNDTTVGSTLKQGFSKKPKVTSPMETYEISDREESECESSDSDSENEKQKKKIPGWALKANLLSALEHQYNGCVEGRRVDPDDIFPEVKTCDLEAIFGGKKSRYTRRTSSGNWTQDKVTVAEKLVYKRTMGFASNA
eukprot:scaffold2315_cov113-Cylindrotheca_fusiformis.AAC.23